MPPSKKKNSTKSAVTDAYAGAKADAGGPNMAPDAPMQQSGVQDPTAGDPMAAITHLTNLLIAKGILSPHDLMLLPQAPSPLPQPAPQGAPQGDPNAGAPQPPM